MSSLAANAPVCDEAARAPERDFPALIATIGLTRPTRRAICANRRGLPKLSTYMRITDVLGSCSQCSIRSLVETSALLPSDTKLERPRFKALELSRTASPSAPL